MFNQKKGKFQPRRKSTPRFAVNEVPKAFDGESKSMTKIEMQIKNDHQKFTGGEYILNHALQTDVCEEQEAATVPEHTYKKVFPG